MRAKFLSLALLSLLLTGCAGKPEADAKVPTRIEYYLRWSQSEFKAEHSWLQPLTTLSRWVMPAAQAELPPRYQNAFSLVITPVPGEHDLEAEYHSRMVMDPSTYFTATKRLGSGAYDRLIAETSQNLVCESKGMPGWAGPAPKLLSLEYPDRRVILYIGGPDGPPGPRDENKRHYLCSQGMNTFLNEAIAKLNPNPSDQGD